MQRFIRSKSLAKIPKFLSTSAHRGTIKSLKTIVKATDRVFESSHGPIHYLETDGKPNAPILLFIHGFADRKESFLKPATFLADHFKIYLPDVPGFGESFKKKESPHHLSQLTEWLEPFVDSLGPEPIHIAGNSLGAAIAIELTIRNSKRFKSLTLIDSAGIILEEHPGLYQDLFQGKNIFQITSQEDFREFLKKIVYNEQHVPKLFRLHIYHELKQHSEWYHHLMMHLLEGVSSFADPALADKCLNHKLSQIQQPTLIVWGRQDQLFPYPLAFYMQKKIKRAQIQIFDKTGHMPQIEQSAKFARVLKEFALRQSLVKI